MQEKIIFFLTVSIQSKHRDEKGRKKAIANYSSQWPQKTMPVFSANYFSFFVDACLCSITPESEKDGVGKLGVCHKREGSLV